VGGVQSGILSPTGLLMEFVLPVIEECSLDDPRTAMLNSSRGDKMSEDREKEQAKRRRN
jgi:hypothetical protein